MINIPALNSQLVAQDEALRATFAQLIGEMSGDAADHTLVQVVAAGLASIHERQGNLIISMVQTN